LRSCSRLALLAIARRGPEEARAVAGSDQRPRRFGDVAARGRRPRAAHHGPCHAQERAPRGCVGGLGFGTWCGGSRTLAQAFGEAAEGRPRRVHFAPARGPCRRTLTGLTI